MPRIPLPATNPYLHLLRHELAELARGLVFEELRHPRPRFAEQHRDLVQRTDWLLCAYLRLTHDMDMIDARVKRVGSLADWFIEANVTERRRLRQSFLRQAAGLAFGDAEASRRWQLPTDLGGQPPALPTYYSDYGLALSLRALEQVWKKMSGGLGPATATTRPSLIDPRPPESNT